MTVTVVFTHLQQGKLKLDDEFFISEHAWRDGGANSGGSTMFAKLNDKIRVEDLLKGVIVQSGNDAAIALAEGIAGTEQTFSKIENQLAKQIGLTASHFVNATGLPTRTSTRRRMISRSSAVTSSRTFPVLSDLLDAGVHLEQDQAAEPQFAARSRDRRRWPEDRPLRGSGLWRGRIRANDGGG